MFVSLKWRNFDRYFGYKHFLCAQCQQWRSGAVAAAVAPGDELWEAVDY